MQSREFQVLPEEINSELSPIEFFEESFLIKNLKLELILTNFNNRNYFFEKTESIHFANIKRFYKLVLAFWLGSNEQLEKLMLEKQFSDCSSCIFKVYYCLLTLEKSISLLKKENSIAFKYLQQVWLDFFECYNKNYQLLLKKPQELFTLFKSIIKKINDHTYKKTQDKLILNKTKQRCLFYLENDLSNDSLHALFHSTTIFCSDNYNVNTFLNKIITDIPRYPFYNSRLFFSDYPVHKVILQAEDGIIIDGLLLRKKNIHSTDIILALVGHFPSEHSYINDNIFQFYNLFQSDVLFINHRNYSQRSAMQTNSIERLARDVICFVKNFKTENKNIVLYGMCGGAAHMIVAAELLMKEKIKFKLIVDRFSQSYINFIDVKTMRRLLKLNYPLPDDWLNNMATSPYKICLILPIYLLFLVLIKLLFILTKLNQNFGEIIRLLPEEDVLILQAKSKKIKKEKESLFLDVYVHPENEIRKAVKDKRHAHKLILKELYERCKNISDIFFDSLMKKIFNDLAQCFANCIQLIDNEKLMYHSFTFKPMDLHCKRLYELSTRNCIPINQFINGFFKKSHKDWKNEFKKLKSYSEEEIMHAIQAITNQEHEFELAKELYLFFKMININQDYIYNITSRLISTGLTDITLPIQKLIDSELFKVLDESRLRKEKNFL